MRTCTLFLLYIHAHTHTQTDIYVWMCVVDFIRTARSDNRFETKRAKSAKRPLKHRTSHCLAGAHQTNDVPTNNRVASSEFGSVVISKRRSATESRRRSSKHFGGHLCTTYSFLLHIQKKRSSQSQPRSNRVHLDDIAKDKETTVKPRAARPLRQRSVALLPRSVGLSHAFPYCGREKRDAKPRQNSINVVCLAGENTDQNLTKA